MDVLRTIYALARRLLRARDDPVCALACLTNAAIDALLPPAAGAGVVNPRAVEDPASPRSQHESWPLAKPPLSPRAPSALASSDARPAWRVIPVARRGGSPRH
jgi:hypothetical protein